MEEIILLEFIDEHSLWNLYCGEFTIGQPFKSPLKARDNNPSFCIYYSKDDKTLYRFSDYSLSLHGDIFDFVKHYYNLNNRKEAVEFIKHDINEYDYINVDKINIEKIFFENKIKIQSKKVNSFEYLDYWKQLGVDEKRLNKFNVTEPNYICFQKLHNNQLVKNSIIQPKSLCIAYRVVDRYQIYQPFEEKSKKFRNDLSDNMFFGYLQLPKNGDLCIIDKSMKDVIFNDVLNLNAVSPKGEGIMIPEKKILELKDRFPRLVVMFDNDEAGIKSSIKYKEMYNLETLFLPIRLSKDKTDLCFKTGVEYTKKVVYNLLNLKP